MYPGIGSLPGLRAAFFVVLLAAGSVAAAAAAPPVTVTASVASHHLFLGGSVRLQVRINGNDHPGKPHLSSHHGFTASLLGGSADDSTSITVINGKETTVERTGYIYSYSLRADHTGRVTIPAIEVKVGGTTYQTSPISLTVSKPQSTDAFLLRLSLSRHTVYVGEPVVLTVDWYISQDVSSVSFNLPILRGGAFRSKSIAPSRSSASTLQLPLGSGRVTATRATAIEHGKSYTRITFKRLLVPRRPGDYTFADSSADFVTQSPTAFGAFFGSSSPGRKWVIPGTTLTIRVKKLPSAGRPSDFTGLVGSHFSIATRATPKRVNVGDPISLSITLKGGKGIDDAEIPRLSSMGGFASAFSLPSGRPAGTEHGNAKTFTQTIRARNDRVRRIPSVEIPYFDPSSGRYAVLRSNAITIHVRPTHILTAKDLQGASTKGAASSSAPQASSGGINYNYEGRDLLASGAYAPAALLSRPGPMLIAGIPLAAFFVLLGFARIRRRSEVARRGRSRSLAREVLSLCGGRGEGGSEVDTLFPAFRRYLQAHLGMQGRSPEPSDVQQHLGNPDLSSRIARLYSLYDELRFAPNGGQRSSEAFDRLTSECESIVHLLEGRGES